MPNYQGKEITATLQANTKAQLDKLISGLNRYARSNGLERVKILSKGKDPDGGYKAIIEAHNWNPFKAAKSKYDMRLTPEEKLIVQQDKIAIQKKKLAIAKEQHNIKMEKLRMKQTVAREKNALAKQKLETARIKQQRRQVKGKSSVGSMFTDFIKSEPSKKTRPKAKKRKTQAQPRMVTLRMN